MLVLKKKFYVIYHFTVRIRLIKILEILFEYEKSTGIGLLHDKYG